MSTGIILLAYLFKAFNCISHELLIAKLYAYGFTKKSPSLVTILMKENKELKSEINIAHGVT